MPTSLEVPRNDTLFSCLLELEIFKICFITSVNQQLELLLLCFKHLPKDSGVVGEAVTSIPHDTHYLIDVWKYESEILPKFGIIANSTDLGEQYPILPLCPALENVK
ncbi:hypothetical protein HELRODRAFT_165120 [Helobdella robusta]|uniref:Uncharacterized protein n=1 Tax=Helobdella robusta TaxID=6412 RepID=T1EWB1_HELRO|nr:hypothetical protein HELRODRAFT_165120 [Helobdella robusta]ESN92975.1 hypothetical protein HELRODRAFT_165120 [Helobdella robusta]